MALYTSCMAGQRPTSRSPAARIGLRPSAQLHRHVHEAGGSPGPGPPARGSAEFQRLEQVIEGPQFHGLDGRVAGAAGRDEDHRHLGVRCGSAGKASRPGLVGQHDVQQHHVGPGAATNSTPSLADVAVSTSMSVPANAARNIWRAERSSSMTKSDAIAHRLARAPPSCQRADKSSCLISKHIPCHAGWTTAGWPLIGTAWSILAGFGRREWSRNNQSGRKPIGCDGLDRPLSMISGHG